MKATWWNSTVKFGREQRGLMYRALAAQLRGGVAPVTAFETLAKEVRISAETAEVARAAAQAGAEGRALADGLADTGCFPAEDLGVLRVAERGNSLAAAFEALAEGAAERLGTVSKVLAPNAYYLVVLGVLLFFAFEARDLMDSLTGLDVAGNPAYGLSLALHRWLPPTAAAIVAAAAVVAWGRRRWHGRPRAALAWWDAEYRHQLGIRVADLAARLYDHGGSHTDVLDAVEEAFGDAPYVRRATTEARLMHMQEGAAFEDAIAGRLVPAQMATVLKALAPRGERGRYGPAFVAVAQLQRVLLAKRYAVAATAVRLATLVSTVALLATLARGIYGLFIAEEALGG